MPNWADMHDNSEDGAMVPVDTETGEIAPLVERTGLTPAQARVNSVSRTMDAAMARASTLDLTPDEIEKLKADFPDEAFKTGAAGKENLIYIEHPYLRDRFDTAIGMGQWALVRVEPFKEERFNYFKNGKQAEAARVYATCALIIRGCLVAEATGDGTYYFNNESGNYGDAAEAAMTQAFRRCAKQFGVGLQAWKKDWCEGWWQRRRGHADPTKRGTPPAPAPVAKPPVIVAPLKDFLSDIDGMDATALDLFTGGNLSQGDGEPDEAFLIRQKKVWNSYLSDWQRAYGEDGRIAIRDRIGKRYREIEGGKPAEPKRESPVIGDPKDARRATAAQKNTLKGLLDKAYSIGKDDPNRHVIRNARLASILGEPCNLEDGMTVGQASRAIEAMKTRESQESQPVTTEDDGLPF